MCFIATAWTAESPLAVRVFSNADEVELFRDGKSLGRQKPERGPTSDRLRHPPFRFTLAAFTPGELRAVAYLGGKAVAEHRVRTPGEARALRVRIAPEGRAPAHGGDLVFVHAEIVDAQGTVVPGAAPQITFSVRGPAELVGDRIVSPAAGLASALLRTGEKPGLVTLQAEAPGLSTGELSLTIR
jgi:beta-galactosidase